MRESTLREMRMWADQAYHRLVGPEVQWLEEINPANVLYYRWFYLLCQALRPRVALELGVCRAQNMAYMAAGGAGLVIGVDRAPWQPEFDENVAMMQSRGLQHFIILGDTTSPETVRSIRQKVDGSGPIELLFIDSTHTYNQAKAEFVAYRDLLADGALVVMDDIHAPEEVFRAFQEVPGLRLELNDLHVAGPRQVGFGAVVYQKRRD